MNANFNNCSRLVKLMMRRERVISTLWVLCLLLFSIALAGAMGDMFDETARQSLAETLQNPGMIALMGPVYGADNYTEGAMYSNTMALWVILAVAAMNILLVVRHTRADEEKGRAEVVRSLPTGRLAIPGAALLSALIVNIILAVLTGLGISMLGIGSMGFKGSMLYGVMLGLSGMFFAAVAALFSELSVSSRGAAGYSFFALGLLYVVRAAGDAGNELVSLISPLGLILRCRVFTEDHWWPVSILLLETAVLSVTALILRSARDIEQGYIAARPGRSEAPGSMLSPGGFAFRLLRNWMIAWLIIMFALSASYGSILADIETFVEDSEFYQMVIGYNSSYSITEMFTSTINTIASLVCIIPLLTIVLRLRGEEKEGRAENVLARSVSRVKYMSGYVISAYVISVLLQMATALGLFAASSAVLEQPVALGYLIKANIVFLPALWVMIGMAVALIGILPKASNAIWAYFAFSFFTQFIGRMLDLPGWLPKLSPLGYTPQLPVDEINAMSLAVLAVIAAALTAAGFIAFRRRGTVY